MAIQSHLFRRLEDHAPFAVIGRSIWLALVQNIFFSLSYCQNYKETFFNFSNKRYFSGSKKPPYDLNVKLAELMLSSINRSWSRALPYYRPCVEGCIPVRPVSLIIDQLTIYFKRQGPLWRREGGSLHSCADWSTWNRRGGFWVEPTAELKGQLLQYWTAHRQASRSLQ